MKLRLLGVVLWFMFSKIAPRLYQPLGFPIYRNETKSILFCQRCSFVVNSRWPLREISFIISCFSLLSLHALFLCRRVIMQDVRCVLMYCTLSVEILERGRTGLTRMMDDVLQVFLQSTCVTCVCVCVCVCHMYVL